MAHHPTNRAAAVLEANGIIAHFTDTVAGLACLPNERLLQRLANIKQRASDKGFILLASDVDQLVNFCRCTPEELARISTHPDKPTTWLVTAEEGIAPSLTGEKKKLAVRLVHDTEVKYLCDRVGAIASTSANFSGMPTCTSLRNVREIFGPQIDFIDIANNKGSGKPSSIVDLTSGKIVRA